MHRPNALDMPTAYDEVAYPSAVYPHTHPDTLAAIAILSGMVPVPVQRCRVLELGCGDGFNLIPMAYGLPESEFVGVDLAAGPIRRGAAMIDRLRLENITLHARDVTMLGSGLGEFDYIIAHGFYSWAPMPVRERIMQLCGANLSVNGIAYISYNAYPGSHVRDIARGMMRYHAAHFADPAEQIRQARGILKLVANAGDPQDSYRQLVALEDEDVSAQADGHFFHDDLNPNNQPFYFHEFMAEAQRHGLQFLGEADLADRRERAYVPEVRAALARLDPEDVVGNEQYRDFLCGRAFRRTLLCREGIPLNRALDCSRMETLFLAGDVRSAGESTSVGSTGIEIFKGPAKLRFETNQPLVKAALRRIGAAWPAYLHFPDLLKEVRQDLQRVGDENAETDFDQLAGAMLQTAIAGGIDLRARRPDFLAEPGSKPRVSALARLQIEHGQRISTPLHRIVELDTAVSHHFLRLLDGSRDRISLRRALQEAMRGGEPRDSAMAAETITEEEIDRMLHRLAHLGLLVA